MTSSGSESCRPPPDAYAARQATAHAAQRHDVLGAPAEGRLLPVVPLRSNRGPEGGPRGSVETRHGGGQYCLARFVMKRRELASPSGWRPREKPAAGATTARVPPAALRLRREARPSTTGPSSVRSARRLQKVEALRCRPQAVPRRHPLPSPGRDDQGSSAPKVRHHGHEARGGLRYLVLRGGLRRTWASRR